VNTPLPVNMRPPFAVVLDGAVPDEDVQSVVSGIRPMARFPVPKHPIRKPEDHWDVMIAYDAEKWRQEEKARISESHFDDQARYRGELDNQMDFVQQCIEQEKEDGRILRQEMIEQEERNKELDRLDEEKQQKRREKLMANEQHDMENMAARKKRHEQRTKHDLQEMRGTIRMQGVEDAQKQAVAQEELKCRNADANFQTQIAREQRSRRKQEESDADLECIAENERRADERDFRDKSVKDARMAKIHKVMNTLGKQLGKSIEQHDFELEERVRKDVAESERRKDEEIERKRVQREKDVREMNAGRVQQLEERDQMKVEEKVKDYRQRLIFKTRFEEGEVEEATKVASRRKARSDQDHALVDQMREVIPVHNEHFGHDAKSKKVELALNKAFVAQMDKDGWRPEHTKTMLEGADDTGRLGHHLSVGRYEGPIHPLEIGEPGA